MYSRHAAADEASEFSIGPEAKRHDLRTMYNEFLHVATDAVKRGDKRAAMFCLSQAMRCANTVKGEAVYRRKVLRAMNYVRALPV